MRYRRNACGVSRPESRFGLYEVERVESGHDTMCYLKAFFRVVWKGVGLRMYIELLELVRSSPWSKLRLLTSCASPASTVLNIFNVHNSLIYNE